MKKIYINELETERRNELIIKNEKLLNILCEDIINMLGRQQEEAECCIMNKDALNSIEYHDHYNSFFYTLKDWEKFYDNIDYLYLSDDASARYDKIKGNVKKMEKLDYYSDDYDELYEENEQLAKEILKEIEDYLHTYEEYPSEDDAIQYADEMEQLEEYYIEEREDGTTDGVIRKDISYTKCYI